MQHVGIRELKTHLSAHVSAAGAGESIVITARGVAVARLVPLTDDDALQRLIDEGVATPPHNPRRRRPRPVEGIGPISDLVIAQRE